MVPCALTALDHWSPVVKVCAYSMHFLLLLSVIYGGINLVSLIDRLD